MKKFAFVFIPLLLAGCINTDYTGRKFTAQQFVRYYENQDKADLSEYTLIGRLRVTAPLKYHPYEVEEAALEKAKEYGGDIICLTGNKISLHGVYTPNENEFGAPSLSERNIPAEEKEKFGNIVPLSSNAGTTKRRQFDYLLYKKTSEVNRQLGY